MLGDHVRNELLALNWPQSFFSMMSFKAVFSSEIWGHNTIFSLVVPASQVVMNELGGHLPNSKDVSSGSH